MKHLIVAEKPGVARDIARVLDLDGRRAQGYIEGQHYTVTWCFGHLVQLAEPGDYDPSWAQWSLDTLPMIPSVFQLQTTSSGAEQFACVARLLCDSGFATVINACDAGREGELIFRLVYEHAGSRLPIQRLWIASLTEEAIGEGMRNLQPGHKFDALADAARARSQADWLVGINATRCITLAARQASQTHQRISLISVGRVQTPTLALIVERSRERENFTPRDFHTLEATFYDAQKNRYQGTLIENKDATAAHRIIDGQRAVQLHQQLQDDCGQTGSIVELTREESRRASPQFFDLTSLQQHANRLHGWSAKQTLELAQALYETHKLLSYPRTDSRYITPDLVTTLPARLQAVMALPALAALAGQLAPDPGELGKRLVNATKVTDHHAILPTEADPRRCNLSNEERALYELVARRLCAAISRPARVATTRLVSCTRSGALFLTRGSQVLSPGWMVFEKKVSVDNEDNDEQAAISSLLTQQSPVALERLELEKGATRARPAYTEATLLGAMERAGATLEEIELQQAMRGSGLGTPATRADTIETLLARDYIVRKGKSLLATEFGGSVIDALQAFPHLTDARLTGRWESMLSMVEDGQLQASVFMDKVHTMTRALTAHFTDHPPRIQGTEREQVGRCPSCKQRPVLLSERGAFCQGFGEKDCDFVLSRTIASKTLTSKQLARLVDKATHPELRGFTSRAGKKFAAKLKLERRHQGQGWRIAFDFPERGLQELAGAPPVGNCPQCDSLVVLTETSARCTGEDCDVRLWRTLCGKKLGVETMTTLLTARQTEEIRGFVSKKKKRFACALALQKDPERGWTIQFLFS